MPSGKDGGAGPTPPTGRGRQYVAFEEETGISPEINDSAARGFLIHGIRASWNTATNSPSGQNTKGLGFGQSSGAPCRRPTSSFAYPSSGLQLPGAYPTPVATPKGG